MTDFTVFEPDPHWKELNQAAFQSALKGDLIAANEHLAHLTREFGVQELEISMGSWIDVLAHTMGMIPMESYGEHQRESITGWRDMNGSETQEINEVPPAYHWARGLIESRFCDDWNTWRYQIDNAALDADGFTEKVMSLLDCVARSVSMRLKVAQEMRERGFVVQFEITIEND